MTDQKPDIIDKLFNKTPKEMSEQERATLLEQYKLYVEMMDKVSERRHQANSFFLTVNTIIITVLAGFLSLSQQPTIRYGWVLLAAIAGAAFSLTWRRLIQSYGQLNKGKFKIIHLLETRLPARLFDAEWDALGGGDGTVYKPFARTEMIIPIVFSCLYGVLVVLLACELVF